jgi:uncharacterized protein
MRIGLISDTHGLLRPQVLYWLRGSDHLLHAGDICDASVLQALARIAPLTAVRGNNDHGHFAEALQEGALVRLGAVDVFVVHDIADLRRFPQASSARVVVSGHSHKPLVVEREGVLYVNPGSAGPRRFKLPISAGELVEEGGRVVARLKEFAS